MKKGYSITLKEDHSYSLGLTLSSSTVNHFQQVTFENINLTHFYYYLAVTKYETSFSSTKSKSNWAFRGNCFMKPLAAFVVYHGVKKACKLGRFVFIAQNFNNVIFAYMLRSGQCRHSEVFFLQSAHVSSGNKWFEEAIV